MEGCTLAIQGPGQGQAGNTGGMMTPDSPAKGQGTDVKDVGRPGLREQQDERLPLETLFDPTTREPSHGPADHSGQTRTAQRSCRARVGKTRITGRRAHSEMAPFCQ